MKIFLNIEAETPAELATALYSLGSMAGRVEVAGPAPVDKVVDAEPVVAEEPKKTRGKAKPTVETAPQNTAAAVGGEVASSSTAAETDEPAAITHEEVRNQIIDLLNDWSAAAKDNPAIRTDTLGPLLKKLDAEKIGGITPDKYKLVPGLVAESRAALKAYVEAHGAEE